METLACEETGTFHISGTLHIFTYTVYTPPLQPTKVGKRKRKKWAYLKLDILVLQCLDVKSERKCKGGWAGKSVWTAGE